jgi:hypothetical protein
LSDYRCFSRKIERALIRRIRKVFAGKDIESFGMYGYDTTLVGIKQPWKRLELSLSNNVLNEAKRFNVWSDLNICFKGVTGSIEFDNKGDPVNAKYFVLQLDILFRQTRQGRRPAGAGPGQRSYNSRAASAVDPIDCKGC